MSGALGGIFGSFGNAWLSAGTTTGNSISNQMIWTNPGQIISLINAKPTLRNQPNLDWLDRRVDEMRVKL